MNTNDMQVAIIKPNGFFSVTKNRRVIMDDPERIAAIASHYWSTYFPAPSAVNTHHVRLELASELRSGFSGTMPRVIGSPTLCQCEEIGHEGPRYGTPGERHAYLDAWADYGSWMPYVGPVCRECANRCGFGLD